MKYTYLIFCTVILGSTSAQAEVQVEKSCWTHISRGGSDKTIHFVLKTYKDTELDKEVGAFVQYIGSKETIPVVFKTFTPTGMEADQEDGNYELTRVEVINGKIGGEYVFTLSGMGVKRGRGAAYKKSKTAKPILFYYDSNEDGTCPTKLD